MKTASLIQLLSADAHPVNPATVKRALAWPMGAGVATSVVLSIAMLGLIPLDAFLLPAVWVKLAYGATLVTALAALLERCSRPGVSVRIARQWALAVFTVMGLVGLVYLVLLPDSMRIAAVFGQSWLVCPWLVLGLSIPALLALLFAAKQLAPTNLASTGFCIGLLAGAIGAFGYSFSCPETSLTFVAIWYTVGVVLAGVLGRILGPKVLRW
jgi:hypothetical protein